jgi:serine/threonine-protein kinase
VSSPSSCLRCSRPAALLSPLGLCPDCAATGATADPTPLVPASSGAAASAATATAHLDAPTATHGDPAAPAPLPPAPPGYELVERLGSGGMGSVYLARDQATERLVAMKFLHHPGDPDAVDRFLLELRVLAQLDHGNIVRVLASDFLRASPFFTMEYLPGGSLSRALDLAAPLPVDRAVRLIRAVAGAVAAAHAKGVIHRDLKPSNVLLAADGTPKVADFGLAKRLGHDDQLTQASGALGTARYMPPEQVSRKNGEVGPWSDVYGLGATLYHLLTGRPPFSGDTSEETIVRVLSESPPRPRALRPDIPLALEAVVLKCLAKDQKDRYPGVAEFLADLDRYEAGQKPHAPQLTRRRRLKLWTGRNRRGLATATAAAAVLVVAGVALGMWLTKPRDYVAAYQRDLKAGKPVALVPAKGLPAWHRWAFGTTGLEKARTSDDACSFETIDSALLELLPDPGIDRYEVRADLRLLRLRLNAAAASTNLAGLYFARAAPDGVAHAFLAVTYNDFLDPTAKQAGVTKVAAQFRTVCTIPNAAAGPSEPTGGAGKPIRFPPAGKLPGEWRRVRVEVTPERVRAFWATEPDKTPDAKMELLADLSAEDIGRLFQNQRATLDRALPGLGNGLPDWHPRMPIGIWCRGGAVACRNVTVTPLPPAK